MIMEAIILETSDAKKLKKAFSQLKELGIKYSKINKRDLLDLGLSKAIQEGQSSGEASREEVLRELSK